MTVEELELLQSKANAFDWIIRKLATCWAGYHPPKDGESEIDNICGHMHVLESHASGYERYIAAYKCNDKQGEIARQHVLLQWCIKQLEGESGAGASHWCQYPEFLDALRAVGRGEDAELLEFEPTL